VEATDTVDYTFYQIEGEPTLKVAPATEANKPYFNAILRRGRKNVRALNAGAITTGMIASNREEDRALYGTHIVKGWTSVKDAEEKDAPFTPDNVRGFLAALPNWIFDDLRTFCGNAANFLEEGITEAVETGKSSGSGSASS
jgi:hypothetical protein